MFLFQQCSKLIDVFFLLYIIQKLEVDGSETDEPVGFIDVYQVKKNNDLILIIVILFTVVQGQIQGWTEGAATAPFPLKINIVFIENVSEK